MQLTALFVETNGCYFGQPDIEPYDIRRDAFTFSGVGPIIAHPPCQRWGRFAKGSPLKGGETPGADGGCFAFAFAAVNRCGGVLEHPSHSLAWRAFGITAPPLAGGWIRAGEHGWTCSVEQGHYGHVARKATWLYVASDARPMELIWGPSPQRLPAKRLAERGYASAMRCGAVAYQSQRQRQRTPKPFADLLISIAREAHVRLH